MLFVVDYESGLANCTITVVDTETSRKTLYHNEDITDLVKKHAVGVSLNPVRIKSFTSNEILQYLFVKYKLANTLHATVRGSEELYYTVSDGNAIFLYGTEAISFSPSFDGVVMHSLTLPATVTYLERNAFSGWCGEYFYLYAKLEYIPERCFNAMDCRGQLYLPDTLKRIGEEAFYGATIGNLVLPDALEVIGHSAFLYAHFDELFIPEGIRCVGSNCFRDVVSNNDISLELNQKGSDITIGGTAFWNFCSLISVIFICNKLTIDVGAFGDNSYLRYVELNCDILHFPLKVVPSFQVRYISGTLKFDVFQDCMGIEEITLKRELFGQVYFGCYLAFYHDATREWYCVYSGRATHPSKTFIDSYREAHKGDKLRILPIRGYIPILGTDSTYPCKELKKVSIINSDDSREEMTLDAYYKLIDVEF